MSIPREPLRRIAVIGGGQIGILTAIALRRSLPSCAVIVIGGQPGPASFADWSPTAMPFTNKLHDRLGIAEADIVTKAGGSYRLIIRYLGWGGAGQVGALAYGEVLDPVLKTAFAREWGGVRALGGGKPPTGSLAQVLAEAGRFAPPPPGELTPISTVDYALRWHPAAYQALLIERAEALQVHYAEGVIDSIDQGEGDNILAVSLAGQGRIEADLFIDCSGPAAILLAAQPRFAFTDWSATLPTRTVYLSDPGAPMMALEDRIALTSAGWVCEVAGRDGLQVTIGTPANVPRDVALAMLGVPARAAIALTPGRVAQPWIGNVIALGDAAARFEPLGPLHLDLAHRQLDLLLEMLPGRMISPWERAEYNRRSVLMMEGVHEVLALHFAGIEAQRVFGAQPLPGRVAAVIDQFVRRGRIPFREESPLLGQEQFALLAALGWVPGLPPAARHGDTADEVRARAEFDAAIQAALSFAPTYAGWMERVLSANRAPAG